jgi:hypothetical protein
MIRYVENWMSSLPPAFSVSNSDKSWDAEHPRLEFQRLQLHCTGYMTLLMLLKPSLVSLNSSTRVVRHDEGEAETQHLAAYAIDTSLNLMSKCNEFLEVSLPDSVRYFMISFCPFDTAALLCSVLLQDKKHSIPRRPELVEEVGKALYISIRLKGLTKMGNATWSVLTKLTSLLELDLPERHIFEDAAKGANSIQNISFIADGSYLDDTGGLDESLELNTTIAVLPAEQIGSNGIYDAGEMWTESYESSSLASDMNLGVLEGIWDPNSLNFNSF